MRFLAALLLISLLIIGTLYYLEVSENKKVKINKTIPALSEPEVIKETKKVYEKVKTTYTNFYSGNSPSNKDLKKRDILLANFSLIRKIKRLKLDLPYRAKNEDRFPETKSFIDNSNKILKDMGY